MGSRCGPNDLGSVVSVHEDEENLGLATEAAGEEDLTCSKVVEMWARAIALVSYHVNDALILFMAGRITAEGKGEFAHSFM